MKSVNVVATHDVFHHRADIVAILFQPWIENQLIIVADKPLWMNARRMVRRKFLRRFRLSPIRIDPRMEFHTTTVTLIHHPRQRIPQRLRCYALLPREKTRPRFETALIHRIGFTSHLENNGIDMAALKHIQLMRKISLHLVATHTLKLPIYHLYPSSAKLAFRHRHARQHHS